mmetsp:Transcript_82416/g.218690  ORF Transcript_82416/g.218690 Transcript_82416/m.218690 type:complete len:344 (+) Transcript_82416:162-1193(+)
MDAVLSQVTVVTGNDVEDVRDDLAVAKQLHVGRRLGTAAWVLPNMGLLIHVLVHVRGRTGGVEGLQALLPPSAHTRVSQRDQRHGAISVGGRHAGGITRHARLLLHTRVTIGGAVGGRVVPVVDHPEAPLVVRQLPLCLGHVGVPVRTLGLDADTVKAENPHLRRRWQRRRQRIARGFSSLGRRGLFPPRCWDLRFVEGVQHDAVVAQVLPQLPHDPLHGVVVPLVADKAHLHVRGFVRSAPDGIAASGQEGAKAAPGSEEITDLREVEEEHLAIDELVEWPQDGSGLHLAREQRTHRPDGAQQSTAKGHKSVHVLGNPSRASCEGHPLKKVYPDVSAHRVTN